LYQKERQDKSGGGFQTATWDGLGFGNAPLHPATIHRATMAPML